MRPAKVFDFPDKGSRVLREFVRDRQIQRAQQEMARRQFGGGGFAGAGIGRLSASLATWSGAVNSDLDGSLEILRARARSLWANNEYGQRFVTLAETNIVGCGPTLQVRAVATKDRLDDAGNAAIESHWATWCAKADIGGRMSLAHMLRVIVGSVVRDGEVLVRIVRNRALPYGIALRVLEADRLEIAINQRLANGNVIRMGVECDPNGRPVAYHVHDQHPGEHWMQGQSRIERIPASEIYHVFVVRRPEQVRGITWFHPVLQRMNMLHGFEEAAVVAARVGAAKMGIITKDLDAPGGDGSGLTSIADQIDGASGLPNISGEPGEFVSLPAGYSLESWNPEYPHANFESFLKTCLRGAASGLNVAAHNLTGDMTDVNYSSARIAELSERDCWMVLQTWLIDTLARPVYLDWLDAALITGSITFPSGSVLGADKRDKFAQASTLSGRRWAWVDPQKEVAAARERVALGVSSRKIIAAEGGVDFDDIVADLAAENAKLRTAKLDGWPEAPLPHKTMAPSAPPSQGDANANP